MKENPIGIDNSRIEVNPVRKSSTFQRGKRPCPFVPCDPEILMDFDLSQSKSFNEGLMFS
jgi:hypothetical protein